MVKNYLLIALRGIRRQFMYSAINIAGLSVGMACSLVIFLYVYGEWSHDRHFANGERIYRIGISFFNMGNFARGPELLGDYLPKQFEGIEAFTRFQRNGNEYLAVGPKTHQDLVYYIDSSFFDVFSYQFVAGDPSAAMDNPHAAVLTESMARKYFSDTDVVGRMIDVGKDRVPHTVTGIVKDHSHNSHLKASVWVSLEIDRTKQYPWTSAALFNYVRLRNNVQQEDLERALDLLIANEIFPTSGKNMGKNTLEEYLADPNAVKFYVHPLRDIYLKSKLSLELSPGGSETNMYIFGVIAVFILVLAAVNFVNLSTARATRRAKEVGIRKALGTSRLRLIGQFLLESVLVSMMAMVLALGIAELFTFAFFWITGQQLSVRLWADAVSVMATFGFSVIVGLIAGVYPAFYLTAFQAAKVLKGDLRASRSHAFRNGLVIFQFSIAISLIICTVVILRQLNFMSEKDLGFEQENTLVIDEVFGFGKSALTFKEELLRHPGVLGASLHSGQPGSKAVMTFYTFQTDAMVNALTINTYYADASYLDVLGLYLVEGRNFDAALTSDTASVILNESAVRALGLGDNAVGTTLNKTQRVIGVVRDFHWESLRNEIAPVAIITTTKERQNTFSQLALKVRPGAARAVLDHAESTWKQRVTDEPLEYHFLDENFGAMLAKEAVMGKAISFFTVLAIAISCLGLFGLAAYTTEQRTREIGIRKVLGATASNIMMLLNRQFSRLVLISIGLAIPVSYYACREWLSGFAYQTDLSPMIFAASGIAGLLISIATVAFHAYKASKTNPAETLKFE